MSSPRPDFTLQTVGVALASASALLAYFLTPMLRFANPGGLALGGVMLAAGTMFAVWEAREGRHGPFFMFSSAVFTCGLCGLLVVEHYADKAADANDARCFKIQRDMLLPRPRRTDDADLMQALGCRPQGDDDVQFPPFAEPAVDKRPAGPQPAKNESGKSVGAKTDHRSGRHGQPG